METLEVIDQPNNETRQVIPAEAGHCGNGGCTRPIYRGKECFRCWAGTKWTSIWQRIQNKNGNNPYYESVLLEIGRKELIDWVLSNPPPVEMEQPSIDRIDNSKGYSISNIRWLEKRINSKNRQRDIPEGFRKCVGCGEIKPLASPYWGRNGKAWQGRCSLCKLAYDRAWRANQ